jgi:hypothetical protein
MSFWRPMTPSNGERSEKRPAQAGGPDLYQGWAEFPSPTRLATALSVAQGVAFVFPRDRGSLRFGA